MLEFKKHIPFRLIFFSSLIDKDDNFHYGFIGQLIVSHVKKVNELNDKQKKRNIHGQRNNGKGDGRSVIALTKENDPRSGRFNKLIEFASYRNNSYRVKKQLLEKWDGWSSKDGYCHRGGPWTPGNHNKFEKWLDKTLDHDDFKVVPSNW